MKVTLNYNFYDYCDHTEMRKINDEEFKNDNRNYTQYLGYVDILPSSIAPTSVAFLPRRVTFFKD